VIVAIVGLLMLVLSAGWLATWVGGLRLVMGG
jgi:hypothetical protein